MDMPPLDWSEVGMSGPVPTGTVTLLLADAEGSTKLWETAPEEMAAAFANLDRTLADLASVHHGVRPVEQGEGDSFVVAFTGTSDAVACALALQQAPLAPIRLRIGVHTGEVRLRDEGNYIDGVRLHDLRHTCASLAISAGANIKVVQKLLGHKTAVLTLDRYGHMFPDDLDAVANAFDTAADALRTMPTLKPVGVGEKLP
jgi:hypothetical protein